MVIDISLRLLSQFRRWFVSLGLYFGVFGDLSVQICSVHRMEGQKRCSDEHQIRVSQRKGQDFGVEDVGADLHIQLVLRQTSAHKNLLEVRDSEADYRINQ